MKSLFLRLSSVLLIPASLFAQDELSRRDGPAARVRPGIRAGERRRGGLTITGDARRARRVRTVESTGRYADRKMNRGARQRAGHGTSAVDAGARVDHGDRAGERRAGCGDLPRHLAGTGGVRRGAAPRAGQADSP